MKAVGLLATACLLLAGCGETAGIEAAELAVEVTLGATEIETGRGFPVTVVRTWAASLEPSPWDDGSLSPLVLRDMQQSRRDDGRTVQETLRFRAHAFTLEDVTLSPIAFVGRPRDGSAPRIATSGAMRLRVRPTLDPAAPGPPEGPGPRPVPARTGWGGVIALTALLAGLAVWFVRRRRAPAPAAAVVGDPDLALLAALRAAATPDEARWRGHVLMAADLMRQRAGRRAGILGRCRTTRELSDAFERGTTQRAALDEVLEPADLLKFAQQRATPALRDEVLAAAEAFVRATPEVLP